MASKTLIDIALKLYKGLGGNLSKVLGTRSNVNFLGKGKSSEMMVDMDINPEALGVLPQSKAISELDSAMGYLTSGKLNDMQANQLISNMSKMDEFYNPKQVANITDMATGTRDLTPGGLASLRDKVRPIDEVENFTKSKEDIVQDLVDRKFGKGYFDTVDDLPPPGSRGGPEDIAAPISGAGLESIKSVQNLGKVGDDIVNNIYEMAGVTKNAQPVARGNARDFLNTIKDMEDPSFPGGTTLSSVMEPSDFKFMTEGGGGIFGDPLLIVQKYFGPKVAGSVAKLEGRDQIESFAKNLVKIKDARGNSVTSRSFDPELVDDFEFADGGRVPYMAGMLVRGGKMGYQALKKYGIEGKDISRLFASLGSDKSLVGKEKTMYFQQLHKVLRNPDAFPDEVMEMQRQLGLDVGIGFRNGGLAGILEV